MHLIKWARALHICLPPKGFFLFLKLPAFLIFFCFSLLILHSSSFAATISISKGWNMIGTADLDVNYSQLKKDNPQCQIYDTNYWWDTQSNSFKSIIKLQPLKGYLLYSSNNCQLNIAGTLSPISEISLLRDWNMISSKYAISFNEMNEEKQCSPYHKYLFWWNPQSKKYEFSSLDAKLDPNKAYWVWVYGGCKLKAEEPQETVPSYCSSCSKNASSEGIVGVKLAQVSKSSERKECQDFSNQILTTLQAGKTYDISVTAETVNTLFPETEHLIAWVDFNQNKLFENSEATDFGFYKFQGKHTFTQQLKVPLNALPENAKLRIILQRNYLPGPCENDFLGETEDYLVKIGNPSPGDEKDDSEKVFDWRTYNGGGWITSIKNQRPCGSCWAFGILAAVEAQAKIERKNPGLNIDLSEQFLVSCCGEAYRAGSCSGGDLNFTMYCLQMLGVPDETCFPYQQYPGQTACDSKVKCTDWEKRLYKISYTKVRAGMEPKKLIKEHGPIIAKMSMSGDFDSNGIFRCGSSKLPLVFHAVAVVGYNFSDKNARNHYWIIKNSWGAEKGDNGYYKVAYNDCGLDFDYIVNHVYLPGEKE